MATPSSLPPWLFNLDGTFLGFGGEVPAKAKTLDLEVEGEVLAIKVPKELRESLRLRLEVGDRLRCIGRSHVDSKTGTIKLRAYQVFKLLSLRPQPRTQSANSLVSATSITPAAPAPTSRFKIQVCRKSGCQKRGGQEMVVALQQALRDRNLHTQIEIQYTGCQKRCSEAPNLTIMPGKHHYGRVKPSRLSALLDRHL